MNGSQSEAILPVDKNPFDLRLIYVKCILSYAGRSGRLTALRHDAFRDAEDVKLSPEASAWLRGALSHSLGRLPSTVRYAGNVDAKTVHQCLTLGLVEPIRADQGFIFQLTEKGRSQAWRARIDALKAKAQESIDKKQTLARVEPQNEPALPHNQQAHDRFNGPAAREALSENRSQNDALRRLREYSNAPFSPINMATGSTRRAITRSVKLSCLSAGILLIGIALGIATHAVLSQPGAILATDGPLQFLNIEPAAGPREISKPNEN